MENENGLNIRERIEIEKERQRKEREEKEKLHKQQNQKDQREQIASSGESGGENIPAFRMNSSGEIKNEPQKKETEAAGHQVKEKGKKKISLKEPEKNRKTHDEKESRRANRTQKSGPGIRITQEQAEKIKEDYPEVIVITKTTYRKKGIVEEEKEFLKKRKDEAGKTKQPEEENELSLTEDESEEYQMADPGYPDTEKDEKRNYRPDIGDINDSIQTESTQLLEDAATAFLYREDTEEKIVLNRPIFRIGKSGRFADYIIKNNPAVSRRHLEIIKRDGNFYARDKNSTNGSFLDGIQLPPETEIEIKPDQILTVANVNFRFENIGE